MGGWIQLGDEAVQSELGAGGWDVRAGLPWQETASVEGAG